jgi:DNA-binding response OmpR family regulator
MQLLSAYSVAEALKIMATRLVNLVILDLEMPGARGTTLIQQLKAFNRTSAIRIIVLSGSAEGDESTRLLSLGADDFLQKPPDFSIVQRAVATQFTRNTNISDVNDQTHIGEQRAPQAVIHEVVRRVSA